MKFTINARTTLALAAAVLLSGATAASAAMMQPKASDSLTLTGPQQKTAWNDLSHATNQTAPADFTAMAGAKLPTTLKIKAVPTKAARDVAALRPYDFAKVSGKILIVNPSDRTVADVLTG